MERCLEFQLLGPIDLIAGEKSILPGGSRQRDLLALLLLEANRTVSTDRLIDRLWDGAPPATAGPALQVYVAKLRKLFDNGDPARIITGNGGYRLEVDPSAIDSERFEHLTRQGHEALRSGSVRTAAATLHKALDLWRGDALADVRHLEGARVEATRLDELRAQALGDRIDAELAVGHHSELIAEIEHLVDEHPLRERHWAQLMLALYRDGRQADALRTYQRAATTLGEELGIEPGPDLHDLEERILLQDPTLLVIPVDANPPTNLEPRLTSFIGRYTELERLTKLVGRRSLVTLTGPGGCGKTRLAMEVGNLLLPDCPDGVWFVDLAPLVPGSEIVGAVSASLNVTPEPDEDQVDALRTFFQTRRLLLILDNCEHVLGGCVDLISKVPLSEAGTSVLATSRQRLNVPGETSWTVPPMSFPARDAPVESISGSDAVALFLDRARNRMPDLEADTSMLLASAQICRQLDGLPLAIELAAARANVLSISEIAERLTERLSFLTRGDRGLPHRHVALRETMQWSYDLLDERERRMFERLSVFRGGYTLEAARVVGATGTDTLDLLSGLVEKSLAQAEMASDRPTRYRSLETLREFGAALLEDGGLSETVESLHRDFYVTMARDAATGIGGPDETACFARLEDDHDNLRAVFDRSATRDPASAVELAESLTTFWRHRGHAPEGRRLLRDLLDRHADLEDELTAKAEWALGVLSYSMDDYDAARISMERALEIERSLGNSARVARILNGIGVLSLQSSDYATARMRYEESAELFEAIGDEGGRATAELNQGIAWVNLGDLGAARAGFESACRRFQSLGDDRETAHCLLRLGFVEELEGNPGPALELRYRALDINRRLGNRLGLADSAQATADLEASHGSGEAAARLLLEALELYVDLGSQVGVARVFFTTALIASKRLDPDAAAVLYGAEEAIREETGAPIPTANQRGHDDLVADLVEQLGKVEFEVRRSRGRMLAVDEAVDQALRVLHRGDQRPGPGDVHTSNSSPTT